MGITHVLRGEDLLSSTPRQVVLYRALMDIGRAQVIPEFGHLPTSWGRATGSCPSETPVQPPHPRYRGMIPEGLLNYLALLAGH